MLCEQTIGHAESKSSLRARDAGKRSSDGQRNGTYFLVMGKKVVMTGAAQGLGLAFAQVLAGNGGNTAVLNIIQPDEALDRTEANYGVKREYYKTIVTKCEEVTQVVEENQRDTDSVDMR